jgi:Flp pilus assembly pilin Flp
MREIIIRLLSDASGTSAVEDGLVLGVCSTMILTSTPVIGSSVGSLRQLIGKFLGLI